MSKDEALKLALEALENHEGNYKLSDAGCDRHDKAITAIKQARSAPVQEPVAIGWDTKTDTPIMGYTTPPAQPAPVPLTDEQKRDLIKKSALWDMHIHIGWYSAPAKSFVEKTIQLIADIEAAHGITKGQP